MGGYMIITARGGQPFWAQMSFVFIKGTDSLYEAKSTLGYPLQGKSRADGQMKLLWGCTSSLTPA